MKKWSWKARFRQIEEAVYIVRIQENVTWEELTLEQALEIARDIMEMCNKENGDWYTTTYDKRQYNKAMRFIREFGKS